MRILVLGGSGFIGAALVSRLVEKGHDVAVSTRSAARPAPESSSGQGRLSWVRWDGVDGQALQTLLGGVDAVVNLLGENLAARRWSPEQKARIVDSRVRAGEALAEAFVLRGAEGLPLPHTLLQASACGYYGLWEDMAAAPECTEASPVGAGFLADTCLVWESASRAVETLDVRRCLLRTAPVLGRGGGFAAKMLPSFRAFAGAIPGSGKQPLSWIYIDDAVSAMVHLLEHETAAGPYNLSSPNPVTMETLARTLGQVLHRPVMFRAPGFLLSLVLGEMAGEMLLAGQKALPCKLLSEGFTFAHPQLEEALRCMLRGQ